MLKKKRLIGILSVLLIIGVVLSSVTVAFAAYPRYESFSVTENDKTYYYHTDGTIFERIGTSGTNGNGRLNAKLNYSDNRFMLVEDNQKFVFTQVLWLQQAYQVSAEKINFYSLELYHDGTVFEDESADGLVENRPEASGVVKTDDMLNNHNLTVKFEPIPDPDGGKENSKEVWEEWEKNNPDSTAMFPSFDMSSVMLSVGGNKQYFFKATCSFTANDALESNFYYEMHWKRDVPRHTLVPVNIQITDAREVVKKAAEYEAIIANPAGYTAEQIAQYHKYLKGIPEGMLDGSKYYTQEQVSTVYDFITGKINGYADTEEYEFYRDKALELTQKDASGNFVHSDVYTKDSLEKFESEFYEADIFPLFPLPESKQDFVDDATNTVKAGIGKLENGYIKDQSSNNSTTDSVWDSSVDTPSNDLTNPNAQFKLTNTEYKFIQIKDNQKFTFSQQIFATGVGIDKNSIKPYFMDLSFDEKVCQNPSNCNFNESTAIKNNTTEFLKRLSSANKTTVDGVVKYKGWDSGSEEKSLNISDGVLSSTELSASSQLFGSTTIHKYDATANITISGNPTVLKSDGNRKNTEETDLSFYWKLTSVNNGVEYHAHIPVSIAVSDIRAINELYDQLYKFVNLSKNVDEREKYTADSVTAVENSLKAIPQDLLLGTKYYTQKEINQYYNNLFNSADSLVAKNKADAQEYNKILAEIKDILSTNNADGRYNSTAWDEFESGAEDIIETVGKGDKYTAEEQSKIDSAANTLTNLKNELYKNRYVFVTFKDENGSELTKIKVIPTASVVFSALSGIPTLPSETAGNKKYAGWQCSDGSFIKSHQVITEDIILTRALEDIKILAKENTGALINDVKNLFYGLESGNTVQTLLNSLDNDLAQVVVTKSGSAVKNTDLIATGMKIDLVSKVDGAVIDTIKIVVKGDVTGDGKIDNNDYGMATAVCARDYVYKDDELHLFEATDMDGDGVLDVIDLFNISNARYN